MPQATVNEDEFIRLWRATGGGQALANELGIHVRAVLGRRRRIEASRGIKLDTEIEVGSKPRLLMPENQQKASMTMPNGVVAVASDCHYLPGEISTAHMAFCEVVKRIKPDVVMLNGDVFDFAQIGRHPAMNTRPKPTLKAEIEWAQIRVGEIERAAGKATLVRTLGNHDARLEMRIANNAPEFAGLITLDGILPRWKSCVSMMLNGNTMFLHKWHQGIHAAYNNVLKAGTNIVTGHTHKLLARAYTDYNGTRFGIETGTLADPDSDAFEYTMSTPCDWVSGFVVLTFVEGEMLYPEFAQVRDGKCYFRGEIINV